MEFPEPVKKVDAENIFRLDQKHNLIIPAKQIPEFLIILNCLVMSFK